MPTKLRPHQHEPVNHLLEVLRYDRTAADLSDTGTGKTYVAGAVATALKLPTLVVTPLVAINQWHRAADHFGDKFSVINYEMLRTGRTPFGKWDKTPPAGMASERYFECLSCQRVVDFDRFEPCYCHPQGIHFIQEKKKKWKYGDFHFHPNVGMVIFDEGHRCGALDSLNADMMMAARRDVNRSLVLSATAACSPLKMYAMGYFLDVHTGDYDMPLSGRKKFYTWACRYGVRREPRCGLQWRVTPAQQQIVMAEVRKQIIPARGVRVTVEDIPGFPEREITSELYDLEENGLIDRLYADMAESIQLLEDKASGDANPDNPLTIVLRARQKIELLKVPIAVELARDYMDKGYSVGIFVNFSETIRALRERLNCDCFIDGSAEGKRKRQINIDRFQSHQSRLILANNEAGGIAVDLPDLDGNHRRVGLVFPCFSAVTMRQVFGRFHRLVGKSICHYRIIFAANTIETKVHKNLQTKLNNLDALNDLDLMPENLFLTRAHFGGTT